jgi:hypothetical protein
VTAAGEEIVEFEETVTVELELEIADVKPLGRVAVTEIVEFAEVVVGNVEFSLVVIETVTCDGGLLVVLLRVVESVPERSLSVLLKVPVEELGLDVELVVMKPELPPPVLKATPSAVWLDVMALGEVPVDVMNPELPPPVLKAVPPDVALDAKGVGTTIGPDEELLL